MTGDEIAELLGSTNDRHPHTLQRASWQAEKLFKARGWLRTMVWCTETAEGHRQMFEPGVRWSGRMSLMPRHWPCCVLELRAGFAAGGVVRYAVALPGARHHPAVAVLPCISTSSAASTRSLPIEAHAADAHLRAHRAIVQVGGVARLAALGAIEVAAVARFGSLIAT